MTLPGQILLWSLYVGMYVLCQLSSLGKFARAFDKLPNYNTAKWRNRNDWLLYLTQCTVDKTVVCGVLLENIKNSTSETRGNPGTPNVWKCIKHGRKYNLEKWLWKHVGFLNNLTLTKFHSKFDTAHIWTTSRSLMSHQIKTGCNTHTS